MRYLRKFRGDDITVDDLVPSFNEVNIDNIPEIQQKKKFASALDDLPIRVKTRFNGKNGNPTRRVVSTPIFDLVTPMKDLGLAPPPRFSESFITSHPRPTDQKLKMPKRRPPPRDGYSTPPTKNLNREKTLLATPPLPRNPIMYHHHEERPAQKRDISMPIQLLQQNPNGLHRVHDYTNIIQIYEENSPFGLYQRDVSDPIDSHSKSYLSSPELNSNSSASDSDTASNPSSTYSFTDSPEDDVISVEPSVITKNTNENPSNFKSNLHPRDSIRYMRNYDDTQKGFQIKTKTPPVLPQHTMNITKKDPYYNSRASFDGGHCQSSSITKSPCNERDTAIFTRRSRELPPTPGSKVNVPQQLPKQRQPHPQAMQQQQPQRPQVSAPRHASSPRMEPIMFHQFQSPGYTGGLRVVNRVPT